MKTVSRLSLAVLLVSSLSLGVPVAAEKEALMDPARLSEKAPDSFEVRFDTTQGEFVVEVHRDWSPVGADRFYNLVKSGFYDDTRFFRVLPGFVVQFGIHGDPLVAETWTDATIQDDPVKESNKVGYVTYAKSGAPNSRTTQVFINLADNVRLDGMGFAPFGQVIEGMDVVEKLYAGYGEGAPRGNGPMQQRIVEEGNTYLDEFFPKLDRIEKATLRD